MLSRAKRYVKGLIYQYQKNQRRRNALSVDSVIEDLRKLPIQKGDSLFVHTMLSTVGFIEGDLSKIIDAFLEMVGPEGRLFMPAFSFPADSNCLTYLGYEKEFKVNETRSTMGVLTEKFRHYPDVKRSIHPTHSVAVYARDAEDFINEHHLDKNPFGKQSPFYKFLELENSWALTMGLSAEIVTCYRVFETLPNDYPLQIFADQEFEIDYFDINGQQGKMTTQVHNPKYGGMRRNDLYAETLKLQGDAQPVTIGHSTSWLIEGPAILPTMKSLFEKGHYPFEGYFPESVIQPND